MRFGSPVAAQDRGALSLEECHAANVEFFKMKGDTKCE